MPTRGYLDPGGILECDDDSLIIDGAGKVTIRTAVPVPSGAAQDLRTTLAVDSSQAADAYAVLLTQALVLPVAQLVDVEVTYAVAISPASIASLAIFVDGVQVQAAGSWTNGAVAQQSGAVSFRTPVALAAGAHTITTRWRNIGGAGAGILCRPVAGADLESCSMRVEVLTAA